MRIMVPLHISGFWIPYFEPNPLLTGSIGAGIAVEPAVTGVTRNEEEGIILNERRIPEDIVKELSRFTPHGIPPLKISSPVGLGLGYGLSSAISWIISISSLARLYCTGKADEELMLKAGKIAHIIEVTYRTGLGDTIAQLLGRGLVVRFKPGAPGIGEVLSIDINDNIRIVTTSLARMNTPEMLSRLGPKLKVCGRVAYSSFLKNESLTTFLSSAEYFSKCTGMAEALNEDLSKDLKTYERRGCLLGYFIKKGLLVCVCDASCSSEITSFLGSHGFSTKLFRPSFKGVTVTKND